jgi:Type II secretion system protein B
VLKIGRVLGGRNSKVEAMPKSKRKNRLNTTVDKDLLKQFKIVAVQEDKRLNQLLEESIRDVLAKYEGKPSMPTNHPAPKKKKGEQEEPDPNSLSLQGVETKLEEMVKELKDTRRAIEKGPKKISSVIPALTGLVVGLILAGVFFTANYSDLLRYKFELDARAIMLSHNEDHLAKAANMGVVGDSITGQQNESRELRAVGIEGQRQVLGLQPQTMGNGGLTPEFEPVLPTTPAASTGILPASEVPALAELFSLRLNAIAWDENPDQRLAVIGDRILHEGDLLGGATVLRINPDHVVFSGRGEVFIKEINSEQ